jgi:hypothetical protein
MQPSPQQRLKIKKPKLLRSNPSRLSYLINGNTFGYLIDDEDILSGYRIDTRIRRPIEESKLDNDDDLSDYVKFRLWLARQLALRKYNEKWG